MTGLKAMAQQRYESNSSLKPEQQTEFTLDSLIQQIEGGTLNVVQGASEIVMNAMGLLGVRYRFGGNAPETGLDCSGLVRLVFKETFGLILPRRAVEMSQLGDTVGKEELKPGDLVFFNTLKRAFSHVGIYIGEGKFVHAPSSGGKVRVESLNTPYWINRFNGARRIDQSRQPDASVKAHTADLPSISPQDILEGRNK
ncbi:MAG: C40 family peptidase [Burkholderiaceae bacterium]|nr:C40 family peptidase [Burkholderiaceae bacterium]